MATNGLNLQLSGLTFTTGTEKRMLIDNLGQFGFGTMSPSTDFHVVGTGATTGVRFEGLPSLSTNTNFMVVDSNGVIQTRSDIAVGTVITAVTENNNVITVEDNQGASSTLTIDALTGVSYDSSWGITNAGTGTVSANFELPFITGSSLSNGSLSFGVNGGLETISSVSGFSISIAGDDDSSTVNLGGTITIAGGTALTSVQDAGTVTINLDDTLVTPGEYGSSSETVTFTVDQQGRLTAASEQSINITASQVSDFATSAETAVLQSNNFVDSTEIDFSVTGGTAVTAEIKTSSIANSKLVNDSIELIAGNGLTSGGTASLGNSFGINVGAGTGITVTDTAVSLNYLSTDNFIDSAPSLEGTTIDSGDSIIYHDATDNNIKKGLISDLPFVTSEAALLYNTPTYPTSIIPTTGSSVSTGIYSTVGGGSGNTASGNTSIISGGKNNTASGVTSSIGGGFSNTASGAYSTIAGGRQNTASGNCSTVGGGSNNIASDTRSTVGGGCGNIASNTYSTVGGGRGNTASGNCSTVGGGCGNIASGSISTIAGGFENTSSGDCSTIGGGCGNIASCTYSTIGGGEQNTASDCYSTVGGGYCNTADSRSTIGGGSFNTASSDYSTIGGGYCNTASGNCSTVGGGCGNIASSSYSTVSGGYTNTASGNYSTVSGGYTNTASGNCSTVGGGCQNTSSGTYSTIGGGFNNTASGVNSSILGGINNLAQCNDSFIVGINLTATTVCTTFMNNVSVEGGITGGTITAPSSGPITFNSEYSFPTTDGSANTVLLTDGSGSLSFTTVPNEGLTNSSTTFSGTTGTSPQVNLGGTLSFISSDGSVVVSGDSGSDTFDITVAAGVDTFITGGTYTDSTGVLTLTDNDNTTITINGEWNHLESASIVSNVITFTSNTGETSNITVDAVTGGTFDAATGDITVVGSGSLSNISLGTNFVTGVTEVDNVVTITKNGGTSSNFTIQAVTGITYNDDWDIAFVGTGSLGTTPVDLPFVTGGTYNAGTVTLGINGGLESNITITGLTSFNIYDADGTLTSARTVTQDGNKLSFTGGDLSVDGDTFNVDDSANAVGIGTSSPASSAVLEVVSTTKGFLFPRMTESQRTTIGSPATGLMVYQTDGAEGVYIYKSFGWVQVI